MPPSTSGNSATARSPSSPCPSTARANAARSTRPANARPRPSPPWSDSAGSATSTRRHRPSRPAGVRSRRAGSPAQRSSPRGAETPTAVVAQSDLLAVGVISAALEAGLRVPEDVSVVGFDGIQVDDSLLHRSPIRQLTTLVQPFVPKGEAAARAALAMLEGGVAGAGVVPVRAADRGHHGGAAGVGPAGPLRRRACRFRAAAPNRSRSEPREAVVRTGSGRAGPVRTTGTARSGPGASAGRRGTGWPRASGPAAAGRAPHRCR
ncbi:substrate-binding domain-containing protein [Curtobacterium sp. MCPF17_052]|uniref:substrate-binding domain-containing protein n=1 Tax=Curtobacterium sp. MCPF17_052 TaxID=2175655 RepID=UPI003464B3F2